MTTDDRPYESEEPSYITLTLAITKNDDTFRWKALRDRVRDAVNSCKGTTFVSLHANSVPDPLVFEDPDNLPHGLR